MRTQNYIFIVFCLSLSLGISWVYAIFVGHFDGHQQYEIKIDQLRAEIEKEQFDNSMLVYQLKDFQQSVAKLLPDEKQLQAQSELKNFSSVVRSPASDEGVELSSVLYEKGKRHFNSREYGPAIQEFQNLLNKYPLSRFVVEAHFFIAESYFLKNDLRSSLAAIDEMVTLFPQHDLTGFILLRMGQISEINNQSDEAVEIYKTVSENFDNDDLKKQAKKLVAGIEYR